MCSLQLMLIKHLAPMDLIMGFIRHFGHLFVTKCFKTVLDGWMKDACRLAFNRQMWCEFSRLVIWSI
ncbi:hypothetical protein LINPERHAP1_LOCUS17877 [Linum perenne]